MWYGLNKIHLLNTYFMEHLWPHAVLNARKTAGSKTDRVPVLREVPLEWGRQRHINIYNSAWEVLWWGKNRVLWESGKIYQKKCPLNSFLKNELEARVEEKTVIIMKAGGEKLHTAIKKWKFRVQDFRKSLESEPGETARCCVLKGLGNSALRVWPVFYGCWKASERFFTQQRCDFKRSLWLKCGEQ